MAVGEPLIVRRPNSFPPSRIAPAMPSCASSAPRTSQECASSSLRAACARRSESSRPESACVRRRVGIQDRCRRPEHHPRAAQLPGESAIELGARARIEIDDVARRRPVRSRRPRPRDADHLSTLRRQHAKRHRPARPPNAELEALEIGAIHSVLAKFLLRPFVRAPHAWRSGEARPDDVEQIRQILRRRANCRVPSCDRCARRGRRLTGRRPRVARRAAGRERNRGLL